MTKAAIMRGRRGCSVVVALAITHGGIVEVARCEAVSGIDARAPELVGSVAWDCYIGRTAVSRLCADLAATVEQVARILEAHSSYVAELDRAIELRLAEAAGEEGALEEAMEPALIDDAAFDALAEDRKAIVARQREKRRAGERVLQHDPRFHAGVELIVARTTAVLWAREAESRRRFEEAIAAAIEPGDAALAERVRARLLVDAVGTTWMAHHGHADAKGPVFWYDFHAPLRDALVAGGCLSTAGIQSMRLRELDPDGASPTTRAMQAAILEGDRAMARHVEEVLALRTDLERRVGKRSLDDASARPSRAALDAAARRLASARWEAGLAVGNVASAHIGAAEAAVWVKEFAKSMCPALHPIDQVEATLKAVASEIGGRDADRGATLERIAAEYVRSRDGLRLELCAALADQAGFGGAAVQRLTLREGLERLAGLGANAVAAARAALEPAELPLLEDLGREVEVVPAAEQGSRHPG